MSKFDTLRRQLTDMSNSANTSCKEFTTLLKEFGFVVHDGNSGGHKVVTHPAIPLNAADGANYNCGHNQGAKVGRGYIKHFRKLINTHEASLKEHLK